MSVMPYPATVVGLPVIPVHGILLAVTHVIPAPLPTRLVAVRVPATVVLPAIVALPESQRLFHLFAVAPISLYTAGAATSGRIDPDILTLATVRLTRVSVMTLPCTVRSQVMRVAPETVSLCEGVEVPIPTLPAMIAHPAGMAVPAYPAERPHWALSHALLKVSTYPVWVAYIPTLYV
jgi:hypothetical protein